MKNLEKWLYIAHYQNLLETDKVPNLVCDQPEVKIQY